jgi:FKBP-type peptidyl-prolyl cis-trans isomerase FkpA
MTTTPAGLHYQDTTPGTGEAAAAGHHVTVPFAGWLRDPTTPQSRGRKFDSSKDRNAPSTSTSATAWSSAAGTKARRA